jgi:hypothetical protein
MTRYTITTELSTPWYKKLFRTIGLVEPREEFDISIRLDTYKVGEVLSSGIKKIPVKIIKKHER